MIILVISETQVAACSAATVALAATLDMCDKAYDIDNNIWNLFSNTYRCKQSPIYIPVLREVKTHITHHPYATYRPTPDAPDGRRPRYHA